MYNVMFLHRVDDDNKAIVLRDTFFDSLDPNCFYIHVNAYTRNYFKKCLRVAWRSGKVVPVVVEIFDNTIKLICHLQCFDGSDNIRVDVFRHSNLFSDDSDSTSGNLIDPTN